MRKKDKNRFYYFAFESIFDPVFDSQVLVFLEKFNTGAKNKDNKISLIVFGSINDIFKRGYLAKTREIRRRTGSLCFFSFKVPYFFKYPWLLDISMKLNSVLVFKVLFFIKRLRKQERAVCHCRTDIGSYILLKVRDYFYNNLKIICDCRGLGSKEILYKPEIKRREELSVKINKIEKYAQLNSDYIFCVTENFKDYVLEQNNNKIEKIKVIPCCLNTEIFKYDEAARKMCRREMGIEDSSFVVLYAGSLHEWQLPDIMIDIFKIIKNRIDNSIFVIFTGDTEIAVDKLARAGVSEGDYRVARKLHSEMNRYLQAGDLGLLIREDNDVNRVAFPVKFAEYSRSGVSVLSSISSDVINLIERYKLGYKLKDYKNSSEIETIAMAIKENIKTIKSSEYKKKLSDSIEKVISWDSYMESISEIYKSLI